MNITGGFILIAVAVAMVFIGRARGPEPVSFLRVPMVAQFYTMSTIVVAIFGIAVIVANW